MSFDQVERLKKQYTDKYVEVDGTVPELRRFQGLTGVVKTVNMGGRALVQFEHPVDISWYDIEPSYLKLVDKPVKKACAGRACARGGSEGRCGQGAGCEASRKSSRNRRKTRRETGRQEPAGNGPCPGNRCARQTGRCDCDACAAATSPFRRSRARMQAAGGPRTAAAAPPPASPLLRPRRPLRCGGRETPFQAGTGAFAGGRMRGPMRHPPQRHRPPRAQRRNSEPLRPPKPRNQSLPPLPRRIGHPHDWPRRQTALENRTRPPAGVQARLDRDVPLRPIPDLSGSTSFTPRRISIRPPESTRTRLWNVR